MKSHRLNSLISVSIKYTYLREGRFYFQRPIPDDLKSRYGKTSEKRSLRTSDPVQAVKLVAALNSALEAEWARLRLSSEASPSSLKAHAVAVLRDWGLSPKGEAVNDPHSMEMFRDHLEVLAMARSGAEERPLESLLPVERHALALLIDGPQASLNDALEFYLEWHKKGRDEKFRKTPELAVKQFVEVVGDKPLSEITRDDVRGWMVKSIERDQSEGTIRRRLNALNAIVSRYVLEKELDISNKFERQEIPRGAKAAKKRETFTKAELELLQKTCLIKDDDIRHLAAMLSDTCSRLAEIAGLRLEDINLVHEIPHIRIVAYEGRGVKTDEISERSIPLVGVALWAAKRVKAKATKSQIFAFPRYVKDGKCQADNASTTINKWMRSAGIDHTTHEFRHTMADRLREVGCPEDVRKEIGGWSREDLASKYGDGYSLSRTHEYLIKTVLGEVLVAIPH